MILLAELDLSNVIASAATIVATIGGVWTFLARPLNHRIDVLAKLLEDRRKAEIDTSNRLNDCEKNVAVLEAETMGVKATLAEVKRSIEMLVQNVQQALNRRDGT